MAQTSSIDVVALTQALVRIPSPSGGEANVAAFVHRLMVDLGFDAVEVDAWGNVVGVLRGAQPGPTLLFDAHMDVVDVGPQPWRCDPFGGEVADGRLHGRGAADTKGSLAAMLCAAATLPRDQFRGALVVAATVCEENLTGAALGHVLDRYLADVVITGEPTGLRLGVAQKGRATIRLHAEGRSAHTSQPKLGENAVYKMIEAVQRLRHLPQPVDQELGPGILELVEFASEPLPNQTLVPAGCAARFVARTLPGQTAEGLLHQWREALVGLPGVSVAIETLRQRCYTGALLEAVDFLPPGARPATIPGAAICSMPSIPPAFPRTSMPLHAARTLPRARADAESPASSSAPVFSPRPTSSTNGWRYTIFIGRKRGMQPLPPAFSPSTKRPRKPSFA